MTVPSTLDLARIRQPSARYGVFARHERRTFTLMTCYSTHLNGCTRLRSGLKPISKPAFQRHANASEFHNEFHNQPNSGSHRCQETPPALALARGRHEPVQRGAADTVAVRTGPQQMSSGAVCKFNLVHCSTEHVQDEPLNATKRLQPAIKIGKHALRNHANARNLQPDAHATQVLNLTSKQAHLQRAPKLRTCSRVRTGTRSSRADAQEVPVQLDPSRSIRRVRIAARSVTLQQVARAQVCRRRTCEKIVHHKAQRADEGNIALPHFFKVVPIRDSATRRENVEPFKAGFVIEVHYRQPNRR